MKCPYSEFFLSVFSRIRTKYGEILRISPYSIQIGENTDLKNSECGSFSRSEGFYGRTPEFKASLHTYQTFLLSEKSTIFSVAVSCYIEKRFNFKAPFSGINILADITKKQ